MLKLSEEEQRRRAIAWALTLTENTALVPQPAEQALLERYVHGALSLDQLLTQLEGTGPMHSLLYRSQATAPLSADQLAALLEESRHYNQQHQITGLLCYGDGFFVQVLEGSAQAVQALYARIRQDRRHHRVVTLRDAASPMRFFPDWRMAFARSEPLEMYWLITYLEARQKYLVLPQVPITDPHLLTLLDAFRQV